MASGLMTDLEYNIGVCAECRYTVEELDQDYPVGTGPAGVESTAILVHGVDGSHLLVFPHRATCSQHTDHGECDA